MQKKHILMVTILMAEKLFIIATFYTINKARETV